MHLLWRRKRSRYIRGNVYFSIIVFSCLSSTKLTLRFLLICFAREIKSFYQSPLGCEVGFFFFNKQLSGFIISLKIFSRYLLLRKTPSKRFDRFWRHLWNMTILFILFRMSLWHWYGLKAFTKDLNEYQSLAKLVYC